MFTFSSKLCWKNSSRIPGTIESRPKWNRFSAKNCAVPRVAGIESAQHTLVRVRSETARVESILHGVIEIKPAGEGGGIACQGVIVAQAQFRAFCVVVTVLDVVVLAAEPGGRIRIGRDPKTTATLPFAVAREKSAEGFDIELVSAPKKLSGTPACRSSARARSDRKSAWWRCDRPDRATAVPAAVLDHFSQAAWLAMFLIVEVSREDESAGRIHIVNQSRAPVVDLVVAIRLPESVTLPMIVVGIIAKVTDRPVNRRVIGEQPIRSEGVHGREMKLRITARHFHDEIQGAAGLRTELESRAGADKLNPFDGIENRRVMRSQENRTARS